MTQITITINLSDLVDVINNSKNPEAAQHLLSGGSKQDLSKIGDYDLLVHRIIERTRREDGEELTLEAVVIAEKYDPWRDEVHYKFFEGDRDAIPYHSITGTISWNGWRALKVMDYAGKYAGNWADAEEALPSID